MSDLVVRRLLVDLKTPLPRFWAGDDAFRTAVFNALSMSFPAGEQFFIDSVRAGVKALPEVEQARWADEIRGFIGQEATHRHVHSLFNGHLADQGHRNDWEARIQARLKRFDGLDVRHRVAATAATEHLTAILSEWTLSHPEALGRAEPRLRTMWEWHSAEETEHRSTAFDLYRALGGNELWRHRWLRVVTMHFLFDLLRQTLSNLRHDRMLWRWSTWKSAATWLWGRSGVLRCTYRPWKAWFAADFHPSQQDERLARQWLVENTAAFVPVGEQPAR